MLHKCNIAVAQEHVETKICVFLNVQQSHHVNLSQLAVIGSRITTCSITLTVTLSGNNIMLAI